MNAPVTPPIQVRIHLDETVRDQVHALDDEAFLRFLRAGQFAEHALGISLQTLTARPSFLIFFENMFVLIEFCRNRELFFVKSFEDLGDDPEPPTPSGAYPSVSLVERLLNLVEERPSLLVIRDDDDVGSLRLSQIAADIERISYNPSASVADDGRWRASRATEATAEISPQAPKLAPMDFGSVTLQALARPVSVSPPSGSEEQDAVGVRSSGTPAVP